MSRLQETPESGLRQRFQDLARHFLLAEVYVFGSRAGEIAARVRADVVVATPSTPETGRATSDVDIGVRPLPGHLLSLEQVIDLTGQLESLFDATRVDVVLLPAASPFLALEIIRGELLYCADPDEQAEYELFVLRRAGDLAPFQRLRQELALSRYQTG